MSFLHKLSIHFTTPDPLADGLGDDIAVEQAEPEHIILEDFVNPFELQREWEEIFADAQSDPDWPTFSNDN